jgi:tRNA pseudouridine55 synthase
MTSHDVVAKLRHIFGQRQVGHAGTLDPDATGVLVVGLGNATRLLRFVTDSQKSYDGEIVLGSATDTLDDSGNVVDKWDMQAVTLQQLQAASSRFVGDILQTPPMVSAVRVDGRRLHEIARDGIEIEREARPVRVDRFDVIDWTEPGVVAVQFDCGSGTFVRSLADDLGRAVGGGAHLRNLRRTRVGNFCIDTAVPLDNVSTACVIDVVAGVASMGSAQVDRDTVTIVRRGQRAPQQIFEGADPRSPFALCHNGQLIAVFEKVGSAPWRSAVVMPYDTAF